ncbi:hypothetical protein H9L39_00015, partial [Fusarium oxysporum f. sp. albedinis]
DRIRHLEYNEAKPTYERCSKDKMKCDGYLPPKPPKPPRRRVKPKAAPAKLAVVPLGYPIHNVPLLISKPTYLPDRDLISGLTFIASATKDEEIEVQALDLLWRLNRREGLLDSRDVVEMHELSRSLSQLMGAPTVDKHWEPKAAAGTPSIIERLRKYLG